MNLLYLCHRIPYPPDKGDKIRSYHEVEFLAQRHRLHLFCLVDDPADLRHLEPLRQRVASLHYARLRPLLARVASLRALLSGRSLSEAYFQQRRLSRALRALLAREPIDAAVVFSSAMLPYLDGFAGPLVLDYVDVDSAKWLAYAQGARWPLSWLFDREGRRLRELERRGAERADVTVLATAREEQELRSFCAPRHAVAIGNGTDTGYFAPRGAPDPARPYVVFTGAMDYRANIDAVLWYADQVHERVRAARPDAELRVVGSNPAPAVRRLAARPGIEVTGRVPDIRPHLCGATVAVAPLRVARGIQNKVLEALASGVPVVATPAALGGIDEPRGVLVAEDPAEFAGAVVQVLAQPQLRAELAAAGRTYMVERHRWEQQLERLERLLVQAASRRQPRVADVEPGSQG